MSSSPVASRDVRQELVWNAIKARKANLIDANALEKIRKLCREPSNAETDHKVTLFAEQFTNRIKGRVSTSPRGNAEPPVPFESDFKVSLPAAMLSLIADYLEMDDAISFAYTCYNVCVGIFPANGWCVRIRHRFTSLQFKGEEEDPSALSKEDIDRLASILNTENLFHVEPSEVWSSRKARYDAITLFGRGTQLLKQTTQKDLAYFIMLRYMVPFLVSGGARLKLVCNLTVPSRGRLPSGDALCLAHVNGDKDKSSLHLRFMVPIGSEVPPLLSSSLSDVSLHALERGGRVISEVRRWAALATTLQKVFRLVDHDHQVSGEAHVTVPGERAAKYLGQLIHNDPHIYATEVTSSAPGGHGQGSYDVRQVRETITIQTPRTVYKAPSSYYEVNSRIGISVSLPMKILFDHCV